MYAYGYVYTHICTCVLTYIRMYACMQSTCICHIKPSSSVVLCVTIPEHSNAFPSNLTSVAFDRSQFSLKLNKIRLNFT